MSNFTKGSWSREAITAILRHARLNHGAWGEAHCWQRLSDGVELLAMWLLDQARNPARAERVGMSIYERSQEATGWT